MFPAQYYNWNIPIKVVFFADDQWKTTLLLSNTQRSQSSTLTSAVPVAFNILGANGRLLYGTPSAVAVVYEQDQTTKKHQNTLIFTKPNDTGDNVNSGMCLFFVHGVPPTAPYFDLEIVWPGCFFTGKT